MLFLFPLFAWNAMKQQVAHCIWGSTQKNQALPITSKNIMRQTADLIRTVNGDSYLSIFKLQ